MQCQFTQIHKSTLLPCTSDVTFTFAQTPELIVWLTTLVLSWQAELLLTFTPFVLGSVYLHYWLMLPADLKC